MNYDHLPVETENDKLWDVLGDIEKILSLEHIFFKDELVNKIQTRIDTLK